MRAPLHQLQPVRGIESRDSLIIIAIHDHDLVADHGVVLRDGLPQVGPGLAERLSRVVNDEIVVTTLLDHERETSAFTVKASWGKRGIRVPLRDGIFNVEEGLGGVGAGEGGRFLADDEVGVALGAVRSEKRLSANGIVERNLEITSE